MALNNMAKEPARELTESLIGTLSFLAAFFILYPTSQWIIRSLSIPTGFVWWFVVTVLMMFAVVVVIFLTFWLGYFILWATHEVGDGLCDALAKIGLDPRPKLRTVKWWWDLDPRIATKAALEKQIAAYIEKYPNSNQTNNYAILSLQRQIDRLGLPA